MTTKVELLAGSPTPAAVTKRYLTRVEAAQYITDNWFPQSPKTLAKLAVTGGGPAFRKAHRVPIYTPADCDTYARSKIGPLVHSTAELTAATINIKESPAPRVAAAAGQLNYDHESNITGGLRAETAPGNRLHPVVSS
jgi:hypothetical protein